MRRATKKNQKNAEQTIKPEYDVYIFHDPGKQPQGQNWERRHTTPCIKQAVRHAEELHKTSDYPRVEIRKKYFDAKKERNVDAPVKIYGQQPEKLRIRAVRFLKIIFSALAFYALASIVTQNGL